MVHRSSQEVEQALLGENGLYAILSSCPDGSITPIDDKPEYDRIIDGLHK